MQVRILYGHGDLLLLIHFRSRSSCTLHELDSQVERSRKRSKQQDNLPQNKCDMLDLISTARNGSKQQRPYIQNSLWGLTSSLGISLNRLSKTESRCGSIAPIGCDRSRKVSGDSKSRALLV